jgi:hypothetical protein
MRHQNIHLALAMTGADSSSDTNPPEDHFLTYLTTNELIRLRFAASQLLRDRGVAPPPTG